MLKILVRVSLLLVMVVLGFTALMPGWYHNLGIITEEIGRRFLDNEEIIALESEQRKQDNLENQAIATGESVDDVRKREFDSKVRWQRSKQIEELIRTNQSEALALSLIHI